MVTHANHRLSDGARGRLLRGVFGVMVLVALLSLSAAGWITIKASVGQWLIARAYDRALLQATPVSPWPWADFAVIGRLSVPALGVEQYVLDRDTGEALAFGPGVSLGAYSQGRLVVSGHRDTHFAFLPRLARGMGMEWQPVEAAQPTLLRVASETVVDSRRGLLPSRDIDPLTLVTCYPFDAFVPGGPLRYVVSSVPGH